MRPCSRRLGRGCRGGVVGPEPTAGATSSFGQAGRQRRGWTTGVLDLYGKRARKQYKTFVATLRPAGGAIRVVLVDEPSGWVAFVCTNVSANVAEILSTVADRFSLETTDSDCKEIVGAGQQQVQFVWANIGVFNVCLLTFTRTKAWARGRGVDELVDCSKSPRNERSEPPREPRGQASDALMGAAGGGHSCSSTPPG